ncbi:MAG: FimB/Mfa2 family fimbrial subunit [Bacteroidaceae bacterium]|nr:FimB/Mfa2 family fimbrial subunit [Bacteroidaceae bacterium]
MSKFHHFAFIAFPKLVALLLGLSTLVSCTLSVIEEPVEQKSRVLVDVRPFHLAAEDFGAATRTADAPATRLSFAVFDKEGNLVESVMSLESADGSFGTVEMELYPGSYKMVAVAHSGDSDADVQSTTSVILPGSTFTDTFAKVQDLTVNSGEDCSLGMTLPRVTSAFVLRLTDTPPANVKEIQVIVNTSGLEPGSLDLNPTSGLVSNLWKQICTIPVADLSKDVPIYYIGMYPVTAVNVEATAIATDDTEIISHTINNVPLAPNQRTIATGTFFKSQGSGTFTIETTWGADKEVYY